MSNGVCPAIGQAFYYVINCDLTMRKYWSRWFTAEKTLCVLIQRPSWPKRPAIIVIDSATYLLTISSPDINKVAMSLYDITA